MKIRNLALTSILVLALPAAAAVAAESPEGCDGSRAGKHFSKLDADGDGRITEQEVVEVRMVRLERADANGDGILTRDEFASAGRERFQQHAERRFQRIDADNSGTVTFDEIIDSRLIMLQRADVDGDGGVTVEELQAVIPCRGGKRRQ